MQKLYDQIFFNNDNEPALSAENLNAISEAINSLDDRVISLGGGFMQALLNTNPTLEEKLELLSAIALHPPVVGSDGYWKVWNYQSQKYVDSNVKADVMSKNKFTPAGDDVIATQYGGTGNKYGVCQSGKRENKTISNTGTAIGSDNEVTGECGVAIGDSNVVRGKNGVAIGDSNRADENGLAIGKYCNAGVRSVAIGDSAIAPDNSVVLNGGSKYYSNLTVSGATDNVFGLRYKLENKAQDNDAAGVFDYDGNMGASDVLGGTQTAKIELAPTGVYILMCSTYTLATGAIYGSTARMISADAALGTPQNLTLATSDTSKANPATITMVKENYVTIKNLSAARVCYFNLIRIM